MNEMDVAADLRTAVDLATALLAERGEDIAALRVTEASNLLRGADGGPAVWRVTFKLRRLIGDPGTPIGAGGEWFVVVDTRTGSARLAGLGE